MRADLRAALRFARRELRGGLSGFRVFLACLALGVAAIAGVNTLSEAVTQGLQSDARRLHGGDLILRTTYQPLTPAVQGDLEALGRVSEGLEMRAMVGAGDGRALSELKAVDGTYPVYGDLRLESGMPAEEALAQHDGRWGAVIEPALMQQLGVQVGDILRVGEARLELRDVIEREPDRGVGLFDFGPRLLIALDAVPETELIQPGSLVRWYYRIALDPGSSAHAAKAELLQWPGASGWRITTFDESAPRLREMIDRLTLFLTLVGLTALLVGGIGIANAVRAYLQRKVPVIATLKCLGAPARVIFFTYLLQVLALAALGILIGVAIGASTPFVLSGVLAGLLPVDIEAAIYPVPLLLAALFGLLITLTFALWPIARARDVPAATLFRDLVTPARGRLGLLPVLLTAATALPLAATVVLTAQERLFAFWFVVGAVATFALFSGTAWAVQALAARAGRPRRPDLRLAIANLCRPGAPTGSVILSLGFGVTVLVAVALVEANLSRQVSDAVPEDAPTFFFVDIQPNQAEAFDRIVAETPDATLQRRMPHLRARISAINGVPADQVQVARDSQWAVRSERGLTYAAEPLPGTDIVAGEWWPADYAGPPQISFDAELAGGFGVGLGDTLTFNVLGRDITAEITSLREIDFSNLTMQFTVIFAPGTLEAAPRTFIATVRTPPEEEAGLVRRVSDELGNVSAIRVRDALEAAGRLLGQIGLAVRTTASISLIAGALVLAGAVAAGQRRRVYESVVLKVLGATRADVLRAYLLEFALLGIVTALIGAVIGGVVAWVVVTEIMDFDWVFVPRALMGTTIACVLVTMLFGFVGVWRALGQKAAPLLRNP